METKGFFQFEIFINVLVSSLRFIWIPMLWVHSHYKFINSFSAGIVFIRPNRFWRRGAYKDDPRAERVNQCETGLMYNDPSRVMVKTTQSISIHRVCWTMCHTQPLSIIFQEIWVRWVHPRNKQAKFTFLPKHLSPCQLWYRYLVIEVGVETMPIAQGVEAFCAQGWIFEQPETLKCKAG